MIVHYLTFRAERETAAFGKQLGRAAEAGDIIALTGELGAGKTRLAQGIAAGLGIIDEAIASPTYALINEHTSGRIPLYHMDAYRIIGPSELGPIGYDDYLSKADGLMVIEWANNIESELPAERVNILLTASESGNEREAALTASGARAQQLVEQALAAYQQTAADRTPL